MIDALFGILGLVCGLALGWAFMLGKIAKVRADIAGAVARSEYDAVANEKATLSGKFEGLQAAYGALETTLDATRRELTETRERVVMADANKNALDTRLKEQHQELEKMREQLRLEFKNAATSIFDEMSKKFGAQSEKSIGDMLNPLRERLGEFQKMVGESFTNQGKEQHALKSEIERIVNMNEQLRLQAENLTKALRGDVKAQGNWGEIMLERILEESGLRPGQDYILQGEGMGLVGTDGNRLQPDVTVLLPDNKHIIVDSKVSLVAYERYCTEADETARRLHLNDFIKSIRAHVVGLEQKKYQAIEKLGTPDFVLMFLPVEGAYSLAVQTDNDLHSYAWGRKIVLVCPATLFATLRTIASLWQIELQNQNAQEIARQGGALYDKFVGFVEDMQGIDRQMNSMRKSYDGAMNKLSTGRGNLVTSAEKLKAMGIKATKSLPRELQIGGEDMAQDAYPASLEKSEG
jgi:DNA recombination protein RmuC